MFTKSYKAILQLDLRSLDNIMAGYAGSTVTTSKHPREISVASPGPQGATGLQGKIGLTGADSEVVGPTGPIGLQGELGPTGPIGADSTVIGPQGVIGITGDTGDQGIQGVVGDTGIQGIQGIQGTQGIQGIQGITGDTGVQGIQGETGEVGPQGTDIHFAGSVTDVLALPLGAASNDAYIVDDNGNLYVSNGLGVWTDAGQIVGPQGIQGTQGVQGYKGDQGDQGIQGITGLQGIQGIQGIQGDQGIQGIQGEGASEEFKMNTTTSIVDLQTHVQELRRLHQ